MTIVVNATDCREAWLRGSTLLLGMPGGKTSNLILQIQDPLDWHASWFASIDPRTVHSQGENPSDVANTIFPASTWARAASRGMLYTRYARAHQRSRNRRWGTYFLRLIHFGAAGVNQLERAIDVLNDWEKEPGTSIVFHLSSAETDSPQPLGGPCLQLIQLQAWNGRIDMTAVYRNHDYFNKALPNLIGLGRLLEFICNQTSRSPGHLVCHSGHAYISRSKKAMNSLIARA